MINPSTMDGRNTYVTGKGQPNAGAPPSTAAVPGFEFAARVMQAGGFLAFLEIAMHATTTSGIYVLLLDQTESIDPQTQQRAPFNDGDRALLTLGPTVTVLDASGNPLGSTIIFSEAESEAPIRSNTSRGPREFRGFPFDAGCIAVLSSTPGVLTQLTGPNGGPPVGGARFTARTQGC